MAAAELKQRGPAVGKQRRHKRIVQQLFLFHPEEPDDQCQIRCPAQPAAVDKVLQINIVDIIFPIGEARHAGKRFHAVAHTTAKGIGLACFKRVGPHSDTPRIARIFHAMKETIQRAQDHRLQKAGPPQSRDQCSAEHQHRDPHLPFFQPLELRQQKPEDRRCGDQHSRAAPIQERKHQVRARIQPLPAAPAEEKNMATDVSIESMLAGGSGLGEYEGYLDTVIQEVKDKTGDDPSLVSMKIYTALDRSIQDGINKVLSGEDHTWADDSVQAGIAITNVNDGTIVAIGAGRNRTAGDWNYATQALRQPGSTAKPIFDYGPGFEYNDFSTYTLFNDEPWTYTNGPEIGNWDGSYQGLITLRQALSVSRNIPALKAFQQVDKKNIVTFVNGLGIDVAYSTKSENYKKNENNGSDNLINEAYSIGGMSYGVTPLDMAEAYAAFANGGYHIETHAVTKIEYRSSGKTVDFSVDKEKVMADSTAYLMNNVLQYAVEHGYRYTCRYFRWSN